MHACEVDSSRSATVLLKPVYESYNPDTRGKKKAEWRM